jgi:hypothetical protein
MGINTFPQPASSPYTAGTTFGATAGRPASPVIGQTYYNGSTAAFEIWNGSVWAAVNAVPSSVTSVTVTDQGSGRAFANGGSASIAFTPATVGGAATSYIVTSSPAGFNGSGTSSPVVITGQTPGTSYTYTVVPTNPLGSAPGISSTAVIATTLPAVIGTPLATAGPNGTTAVSWTAPNNGGSAITGYTVTSNPGSITATTSGTSVTVTGLTNGTAYTFTVRATNANGTNAASPASNSATPVNVPIGEYLVVGGGGSNVGTNGSGAGGGGAVKYASSYTFPASFTVTVGAGGNLSTGTGGTSVFGAITGAGGGAGGVNSAGGTGASGGGAFTSTTTTYAGGAATDGNVGGANSGAGNTYNNAGGGGGAGGPADTINSGPGVTNSITGTLTYYGAGGAGGVYSNTGVQSINGGARGFNAPGANFGGGAGASGGTYGYVGTAGVVILAYPSSAPAFSSIGGGLTYTVDTTTRAGIRIYRFTAGTGTVTV